MLRARRARPRRIFWRIYAFGLLLLLLASISSGLLAYHFAPVSTIPVRAVESSLSQLSTTPREHLQSQLELLHGLTGLDLCILDGKRIVAKAGHPMEPDVVLTLHASEKQRLGTRWFWSIPLEREDGALQLVVATSIQPLHLSLILSIALVSLIAALVLWPLARSLARPLERIGETAERFGQGELHVRTELKRRDEIGVLAKRFDDMAARIEKLVHAQSELWANVSHEFRTPLARIRVALALCDEEQEDLEAVRHQLQGLDAEVSELDALVEEVLSLARLERRTALPLHREDCELRSIIESAAQRCRERYPEAQLSLTLPEQTMLFANAMLLRRLFENLLDNACKYGTKPGEAAQVELELQRSTARLASNAETVVVQVCDHGPGIPEEERERVFEPFFRSNRTASAASGSGLGLTLCKRIVEAHGGRIEAHNADGGGLVCRCLLPAGADAESDERDDATQDIHRQNR
ncbi:MAG: HAMP domain-containing sensor histidine kinase [Myxococcota bacterium]|jgi:signal transduction histidine kinase|nr:HAMP domain-containing sensor histidine kinase [Myxococcota bacterium]